MHYSRCNRYRHRYKLPLKLSRKSRVTLKSYIIHSCDYFFFLLMMMFDPCNTYFPQATMKATLLETLLSNIFFSFCLRCFLYKKSCWSMTELAIPLTETLGKHLSVATTGKAATQEVWYRSILNMLHTLGKGGCGNQSVSYWSQPLHHCSARTLWKVIFLVFRCL